MRKKFVFNSNKKRTLGDDAYLVRAGLRHRKVIPLRTAKLSTEERNALKEAKKQHSSAHKMVTVVKTHCDV